MMNNNMLFKNDEAELIFKGIVATNTSDYGGSIAVRFAESWAINMQECIEAGERLDRIVETCAQESAYYAELSSGHQYGFALVILTRCWKYGRKLRFWKRKKDFFDRVGYRKDDILERVTYIFPSLDCNYTAE